jgi:hypothetical protein
MVFGLVQELSTHMQTSILKTSKIGAFLMTWKTIGLLNTMMIKKLTSFGLTNMISTEKISPIFFNYIFLMNMREPVRDNSKRPTSKL